MPHNDRDLGRSTRALMQHRPGQNYTMVRAELVEFLDGTDYTAAEAVRLLTDPANRTLCGRCGWSVGMTCPECSGCGCNTTCTGRRHRLAIWDDDDEGFDDRCPVCDGNSYSCSCGKGAW